MVDRINFLAGGKFGFTYRNLALVFAVWLVLLGVVQGGLHAWVWYRETQQQIVSEHVKMLNGRQQARVKALELTLTKEFTGTALKGLTQIFSVVPQWSRSLRDLGTANVDGVVIDSVSSSGENRAKMILIQGSAQNTSDVAALVANLNRSNVYRDVSVRRTSREVHTGRAVFELGARADFVVER